MQIDLTELSNFYQKGHYRRRHLDEFTGYVEPYRLEITADSVDENRTTIYFDKLLPSFIDFAEKHDFDIFGFDHRQEYKKYTDLLAVFIEQVATTPIIFGNEVYFVRCEHKEGGMPGDLEKRRAFIETKELFSYKYYKVSEAGFFEVVAYYNNLYIEHEKIKKQNSRLWTVVSLVGFVLVSLGLGYLGVFAE